MFQSAVWTLKWNDAICHFLKEGFKHVSTNLSVLCPINSTFKNEINELKETAENATVDEKQEEKTEKQTKRKAKKGTAKKTDKKVK